MSGVPKSRRRLRIGELLCLREELNKLLTVEFLRGVKLYLTQH